MRSSYCKRKSVVALVAAVCCLPFAVGFTSVAVAQHPTHRRRLPEGGGKHVNCGRKNAHTRVKTALACVSTNVALTREAGKNGKLAKLLTDAGISSVEVPCIAHQDGPDLPLLPAALADPGLSYVVVTSPEAAKVFLSGWAKAGAKPVAVACVGKATGDALRAGGVTPVFTPSKATGETLAAEIPHIPPATAAAVDGGDCGSDSGGIRYPPAAAAAAAAAAQGTKGGGGEAGPGAGGPSPPPPPERPRVLYPASAKAQKTLESGLEARGFEVRRLNTYDTVPATWDASAEEAASTAVVAAFGSPSAVKTWAERMGVATAAATAVGEGGRIEEGDEREGETGAAEGDGAGGRRGGVGGGALAACIGETSARACREAGWPEWAIFYPDKPGMEGWAKAVGDALEVAKKNALSPAEAGAAAA